MSAPPPPRSALRLLLLLPFLLAGCASEQVQRATWEDPGSATAVTMERWPAHDVLAEYHRRLVVRTPQGEREGRLIADTGGTDWANLYRTADGTILLRDRLGVVRVDPATGAVRDVGAGEPPDGTYLGAFVGVGGRLVFRPAAELPETVPQAWSRP